MSKSNDVVIVSYARSAIGAYNGSLARFTAPQLGAVAIKGALDRLKTNAFDPYKEVEECIMGNVMSGGVGQAPARQAAVLAGLPYSVCCTTVNKVCSSGLKSVMMGAQQLLLNTRSKLVVCGGFESMSNVPYYLPDLRFGKRMQHATAQDGMILDGLTDPYSKVHMGSCAEVCAAEHNVSREVQDEYAKRSHRLAKSANFKDEIVPLLTKDNKIFQADEPGLKFDADKMKSLKPVFPFPSNYAKASTKSLSITPASASAIGDGGACVVITTRGYALKNNLPILASITAFSDFEHEPHLFPTAPSGAVNKILSDAQLNAAKDIDLFEFNEAFAVVPLANGKLLQLTDDEVNRKVNLRGGAIALGHPLGMSGCRILMSLVSQLKEKNLRRGVAAICNGGGGGSAMLVTAEPITTNALKDLEQVKASTITSHPLPKL